MKYLTALLVSLIFSAAATADCLDDAEDALRSGSTENAIEILTSCLERSPEDTAGSWFLLGQARQEQGRKQAAIDSYSQAIELADRPELIARARLSRGELLLKRNREGALVDFSAAIEADPSLADAYYGRARVVHKRDNDGDEDAALADYTRAIELDDSNARAYFYRASIYRKRGLDHLAVQDYDRAIELAPNFVRAHAERTFTFLFPLLPVLFVLILG